MKKERVEFIKAAHLIAHNNAVKAAVAENRDPKSIWITELIAAMLVLLPETSMKEIGKVFGFTVDEPKKL